MHIKLKNTVFLFVMLLSLFMTGCSSTQSSSNDAPLPINSKLAQVQVGMSDAEVFDILGEPDDWSSYETGKRWIPYYYGPDTHRTDFIYFGVGRVIFSNNRYSGDSKVIHITYNPDEAGQLDE